jgi:hypothetical protein
MLAVGQQPTGEVPANALAALDRPDPLWLPLASASIDRYPAVPVAYLPPPTTASSPAMTSIVAHRLCGSIPITTVLI